MFSKLYLSKQVFVLKFFSSHYVTCDLCLLLRYLKDLVLFFFEALLLKDSKLRIRTLSTKFIIVIVSKISFAECQF